MASLHILLSLTMLAILGGEVVRGYEIALHGCPDSCGNMSIPYPFGTKEGCYRDTSFLITCNDTYNPPKAFLQNSPINVTEIMLLSGEFRSWKYVAHQCLNSDGTLSQEESNLTPAIWLGRHTVSYTKNKLTVVGCDVFASFKGSIYATSSTGCMTTCERLDDVTNGTSVWDFDRCSFAFLAEENAYNFSSLDFEGLNKVKKFPMISDWTIANQTCEEAKRNLTSYACKENSVCYDSLNGQGYRCNCSQGYQGNPYLPNSCKDIDECAVSQPCNGICINMPGNYSCPCPEGYEGDGKKDGIGCTAPTPTASKSVKPATKLFIKRELFELLNSLFRSSSLMWLVM